MEQNKPRPKKELEKKQGVFSPKVQLAQKTAKQIFRLFLKEDIEALKKLRSQYPSWHHSFPSLPPWDKIWSYSSNLDKAKFAAKIILALFFHEKWHELKKFREYLKAYPVVRQAAAKNISSPSPSPPPSQESPPSRLKSPLNPTPQEKKEIS